MDLETFGIERRFLGPPNSANGGYVCGRIAAHIDGDAEVTLVRPPPLDCPLVVRRDGNDKVSLWNQDIRLCSAKLTEVQIEPFAIPTLEQAAAAASRTFPAERHPLPTCFVCGPLRDFGDGLRVHAGPLDDNDPEWRGSLAAVWVPDAGLGDESGLVRAEFVWAALDCPTGYAISSSEGMRITLLGRQSVSVRRLPEVETPCIVLSRAVGCEGRKHFAEAALVSPDGTLFALCRAVWIEVSAEVQRGVSDTARSGDGN
ncbi:MAG: hypothetical protein AAF417_12420 [Pseudomonadota bacterium]